MELPTWLALIMVAGMVFVGLIVIAQLVLVSVLLVVVKNLVEAMREHLDPVIAKTNAVLITLGDMAQTVQGKTEHIAERTAETTDVVSDRVEKASGLLQQAFAAPIIGGAAMAAGISKGVETWRRRRAQRHQQEAPAAPTTTEPFSAVIVTPPGEREENPAE